MQENGAQNTGRYGVPDDTRYPIGVQSFEKLRREGYIYVDKTMYIPMLLRNSYYFMARPRRFGKSLFLSMLEAYFKGKKDLFEGLAISNTETDWIEYPVVRIDFAKMRGSDADSLIKSLCANLDMVASSYGITPEKFPLWERSGEPGDMLDLLITLLKRVTGRDVVILIDEYDKGLIETIHDCGQLKESTDLLRPFFSVLKSQDENIKFAFLMGVSRFRNTTIFSGANNLKDISMDSRFASMMGITDSELTSNFKAGIAHVAAKNDLDSGKAVEVLRAKYDGYRFTKADEYVYNPFSLLNALDSGELEHYWVMSGTSKILVEYLRKSKFDIDDLTSRIVSGEELSSPYSGENPLSLFFQTGYLTIGEVLNNNYYRLKIPNSEVQTALVNLLIPEYVEPGKQHELREWQHMIADSIEQGNVDQMMQTLRTVLSSIPYHEVDTKLQEKHLHLCIYIIFMMLGINTRCEVASAAGRVDMVATTPWRVYLLEFKIDGNAEDALRQIDDKGYAIAWEADKRKVVKIGVNFSSALRTIDSWAYTREN